MSRQFGGHRPFAPAPQAISREDLKMRPTRKRLLLRLVPALALLGAMIGWNSPSEAYVQEIIIDQTNTANYTPIPLGSSTPGSALSYTIYTGRVIGLISPTHPLNAVITDINLAPKSGGLV